MVRNQMLIHTLNSSLVQSKDHVIKASALYILHQMLKSILQATPRSIDPTTLKLDIGKIITLFE